jgi:hypothetical protein
VRRFFTFDRGLLGVGIGGPLADLHALMSTIHTEGFKKRLWNREPETSPAAAIDVVAQVAENLSGTILGLEGDVLRKSLQEALLEAAGLGYDPDGPNLEVGLSKFLRKKGTRGFLDLFLSRYVFNAVWIRIQDAVQLQMPDQRFVTIAINDLETLCRSLVKSVLDEWETDGKLDRLERDKQLAESLIRKLEDCLLESRPHKEDEPNGQPAMPDLAPVEFHTIVATVVQDSFNQPRTAGLRGLSAPGQQILLQAADLAVCLKIFESGENRSLLGQLLHRSVESWVPRPEVHLIPPAGEMLSTSVDELGEFLFRDVPKGPLRLQVDIPPDLRVVGDFVVPLES